MRRSSFIFNFSFGSEYFETFQSHFQKEKPPACKLAEGTCRLLGGRDLCLFAGPEIQQGRDQDDRLLWGLLQQPPPFKLSLIETVTEGTVWTATIRGGWYEWPQIEARLFCNEAKGKSDCSNHFVAIFAQHWLSFRVRSETLWWKDAQSAQSGRQTATRVATRQRRSCWRRPVKKWTLVATNLRLSSSLTDNFQRSMWLRGRWGCWLYSQIKFVFSHN